MGGNNPHPYLLMPKVVTQEEIISRFREVHGDKYDYSRTAYNGCKEKVLVGCRIHGDFLIDARNHLRGSGCKECGCESRNMAVREKCKDEFEAKARKVHGGKYDYSLVYYVDAVTRVNIICPKHGVFLQEPTYHLNGNGCNLCALERAAESKKKKSVESFEAKARDVHGEKYDYSLVEYSRSHDYVDIICPIHGVFKQSPSNHLSGCGCPKCHISHMEEKLTSWLESNNVDFEFQKRFPWLSLQSLDFYLPKHNIAIECQGVQHFKPIDYFGGALNFKRQVNRDKLKHSLCKENGVNVIYFCENRYAKYYEGTNYTFFSDKDGIIKYIKENEGKAREWDSKR